jgi:hypothetical protein
METWAFLTVLFAGITVGIVGLGSLHYLSQIAKDIQAIRKNGGEMK